MDISSALSAIETAGTTALQDAGIDARRALEAARAYAAELAPSAEQIVSAIVQARTTGQDEATWTSALTALVQAAALRTIEIAEDLASEEAKRLQDVALGAFHTLITVLVAAA
jgi:hypothetical protein